MTNTTRHAKRLAKQETSLASKHLTTTNKPTNQWANQADFEQYQNAVLVMINMYMKYESPIP